MNEIRPSESIDDYHSDTENISASMLKTLRNEGARGYQGRYITKAIPPKQAKHFVLGHALHTLALEPEKFPQQFAICPHSDRRKKDYRDWKKEMDEAGDAREVLSIAESEKVKRAVDALNRQPYVRTVLETAGLVEASHYYRDADSGLGCKFRPDKITDPCILDLKSAASVDVPIFQSDACKWGYHIQQAHYLSGAEAITNQGGQMFMFAVVELEVPFRCRAYQYEPESAGIGFDLRRQLLDELSARLLGNDWSEHGENELVEISLPNYELNKWRQIN